jgi:Flp pilus assembly protein TadD
LLLARILSEEGNDQAALNGIESVIAVYPQDWRAHECLGRALWRLGKLIDAVKAFRSVQLRRRRHCVAYRAITRC